MRWLRNELGALQESLHGHVPRGDQTEGWGIAEFYPESRPNDDAAMANTNMKQHAAGGSSVADPLSLNSRCRADSDSLFDDLICEAQATLRQKVCSRRFSELNDLEVDGFVAGK